MFACERCGAVFNNPRVVSDNPSGMPGFIEEWNECPECGAMRIREVILFCVDVKLKRFGNR